MKQDTVVLLSFYINSDLKESKAMFASLFAQTRRDFDIFVKEDGPVLPLLHDYLLDLYASGQIQYFGERSTNRGVSFTFNELISHALKEGYVYIVRMDTDDICVPERIAVQHSFMSVHPEIDVVGAWIEEFNTDTDEKQVVRYAETHEEIFEFFKKRSPLANPTAFFRRTFFEKAGLHRLNTTNEDLALWIEGFAHGCRFHNLQVALVKMRVNDAFYYRRHGWAKAQDDFTLKIEATRRLGFGFTGYLYAVAAFFLLLSPVWVKRMFYKRLRG
ncbi:MULTISPECIES: glycosyltransferase [Sulfurimonas]|uniref:Glycosyltransferase n=1 Tax=Sulfurimonas diazotrophicus TaxID=3131939 RepID=A0ABZ3HB78_9BACT